MIEIRELRRFDPGAIQAVMADGYTSQEKYEIGRRAEKDCITFEARRVVLASPYQKVWELTEEDLTRYAQLIKNELCYGAFNGEHLVGIALGEVKQWNRALWVWELHVMETYRGQGIGGKLIEAMVEVAKQLDLRVLVCETQNMNVPAIDFYTAVGFELDGIDLSYYSNNDVEAGEVALFMKRKIAP